MRTQSLLCEGAQEWSKDRKSRPIQQEDEYRLHMELNRCLKKDTDVAAAHPDLFQGNATRAASSRGWCLAIIIPSFDGCLLDQISRFSLIRIILLYFYFLFRLCSLPGGLPRGRVLLDG